MQDKLIPLPDPIDGAEPANLRLRELALDLYRRLGQVERRVALIQAGAERRLAEAAREAGRSVAALARERFEFQRLLQRLEGHLQGQPEVKKLLRLFDRGWGAVLDREGVELRDLTGRKLTDELAEVVRVNCATAEESTTEAFICETIAPLVLHKGKVAAPAIVNTSVPGPSIPPSAPEAP